MPKRNPTPKPQRNNQAEFKAAIEQQRDFWSSGLDFGAKARSCVIEDNERLGPEDLLSAITYWRGYPFFYADACIEKKGKVTVDLDTRRAHSDTTLLLCLALLERGRDNQDAQAVSEAGVLVRVYTPMWLEQWETHAANAPMFWDSGELDVRLKKTPENHVPNADESSVVQRALGILKLLGRELHLEWAKSGRGTPDTGGGDRSIPMSLKELAEITGIWPPKKLSKLGPKYGLEQLSRQSWTIEVSHFGPRVQQELRRDT